jgi:hypothetical protein
LHPDLLKIGPVRILTDVLVDIAKGNHEIWASVENSEGIRMIFMIVDNDDRAFWGCSL